MPEQPTFLQLGKLLKNPLDLHTQLQVHDVRHKSYMCPILSQPTYMAPLAAIYMSSTIVETNNNAPIP